MNNVHANYFKFIWWLVIIGVIGLAFGWVWALIPLAVFVVGVLWVTATT